MLLQDILPSDHISKLGLIAGGSLLICGSYYVFKRRNCIPGPFVWPIIGNSAFLYEKYPHLVLNEMAIKYGNLCSIKIFNENFIIISNIDNIYDLYVNKQDDFSDRKLNFVLDVLVQGSHDLSIMQDTEKFRESKKFTMRSLKSYGEGLSKVEDVSADVIGKFLEYLEENQGKPIDIGNKLKIVFCSIVTSMTFNEVVDEDLMEKFVNNYTEVFKLEYSFDALLLGYFPWLRFFGNKTYKRILALVQQRERLLKGLTERIINEYDENDIRNVTDQMYHFMDNSCIDYKFVDLYKIIAGLIVAGFITSSSTLYGLLAILMNHSIVYDKIYSEIADKIGFSRTPKLEDKVNMPYTEATILEAHRILTIAPFSLPHVAKRSSTIGCYKIKKGTVLWPNIWGLHHDEKIWGDPNDFRPERFLDKDGKILTVEHKLRKW